MQQNLFQQPEQGEPLRAVKEEENEEVTEFEIFAPEGQKWLDSEGLIYRSNGIGLFIGPQNETIIEQDGHGLTLAPVDFEDFIILALKAKEVGFEAEWVGTQLERFGATIVTSEDGETWESHHIPWEHYNAVSDLIDQYSRGVWNVEKELKAYEAAMKRKDEKKRIEKVVAEVVAEVQKEEPPKSASLTDLTSSPILATSSTGAPVETAWIDGKLIDLETGLTIEMDPIEEASLRLSAEDALVAAGEDPTKFKVCDEESARWVVRLMRDVEKQAERYHEESKDLQNQLKVITAQTKARLKGLNWRFGQELLDYTLAQIRVKSNGELERLSKVYPEGTVKLLETGGPTCYDPAAFKYWLHNLPEEEHALWPVKLELSWKDSDFASLVEAGVRVPGWANVQKNPHGAVAVTKSTPRKAKGEADEK